MHAAPCPRHFIRKLLQTALRTTTHDAQFAENGVQGLALIERMRPDVVFTDVAMPEMDGFEMADAVRARPELAHIPIVFMTASAQREVSIGGAELAAQALRAGLVAEVRLFVSPVAVGGGKRVLPDENCR